MPTATLGQRIDLLEQLLRLDDLIEQAQAGLKVAGGTPPTGDPFADFELGRIVDLAKELSTTVKDALAPIGTANQAIDAVQAFARLAEAAERAERSTGAEKAEQFGAFLAELNGAAGAIGWVVEGFSVTPVFGMYVFYLTKSLEALACSIGYIEEYYDTVTGVWPDVLDPAWIAQFEEAAERAEQKARMREVLEQELYDLRVERWMNERAADRNTAHAATTVCLRELRANDPQVPATEDGLNRYLAGVSALAEQVATDLAVAAQQPGTPAGDAAAARAAAATAELRDHQQRVGRILDCIGRRSQQVVQPMAPVVPVAQGQQGPAATGPWAWWAVAKRYWKHWLGGLVVLALVVTLTVVFATGGDGGSTAATTSGSPVASPANGSDTVVAVPTLATQVTTTAVPATTVDPDRQAIEDFLGQAVLEEVPAVFEVAVEYDSTNYRVVGEGPDPLLDSVQASWLRVDDLLYVKVVLEPASVGQLTFEFDLYEGNLQVPVADMVGARAAPLPYFEGTVAVPDGTTLLIGPAVIGEATTGASLYVGQTRGDTFLARGSHVATADVPLASAELVARFTRLLDRVDPDRRELVIAIEPDVRVADE
ncbi:MAG: hypothetical protein KDB06_05220 [Ilumatobacter sp.]|nr:hypothetical protein [Ilumatobacter sp.]